MRLFRNIRHRLIVPDSIRKYVLYAIGEIILVVIGILIALQINNWNEDRKIQIAQRNLLLNFHENLAADSIVLHGHRQTMLNIIETQKQLHAFRKGLLESQAIENPQNIRGSFRNYSITKSNYPNIDASIFNEQLKEEIREYYRLLSFLENAYIQYDNVVKQSIRPYLASNFALNPDYIFEKLDETMGSEALDLEKFYVIVKSEEFGQILFESNLKATETVSIFNKIMDANSALRNAVKIEIKKTSS